MSFAIVPKKQVWLGKLSLTGVYFALCCAFLLWALDDTKFPRSVDNLFYDACLRSVSQVVDVPAHVLLVEGSFGEEPAQSPETDSDATNPSANSNSNLPNRPPLAVNKRRLLQTIQQLSRLNARAIGITFPISDELAAELQHAHRQIVFTRHSNSSIDSLEPSPVDKSKQDADLQFASHQLLPPMNGVHRDHFVEYRPGHCLSLEGALARSMLLPGERLPASAYRIFFRGGADSLPHTTAENLIRGYLTEDLVAGKAILIGSRGTIELAKQSVPTTNGTLGMSWLEIRGHALNTLLVNRPIHRYRGWLTLLLSLAAALWGQYVFRRVRVRLAAATYVAMVVAVMGGAWVLLAWLHLWMPCVPLAAVFTFCFAVAAETRLVAAGQALQLLRLRRTKKNVDANAVEGTLVDNDPWTDLVDLTFQMFYLRRLVILELPAGRDHLVPVKFVSCGHEDVGERRRDYRRSPYSDALRNGPTQPNYSRRFFVQDDPQDIEFLVPLTFGGQVVGFLAVSLNESVLEESPEFNSELDSLAKEIALLIAQHRTQREERESLTSLVARLIQRVPEDELFEEIEVDAHVTARRSALLDDVFQSSETSSAIYDAFGQLVTMNKAMFRSLQDKGALPDQLTALEAMTFLTRQDASDCRDKLRRAIIDGRQQAILIDSRENSATSVLHLRPVSSGTASSPGTSTTDPFEVQGLHLELVDTSVLHQIQGAKKRLADNVFGELEVELDQLRESVNQLNSHELPAQQLDRLRRKMAQELSASISTVATYKGYLSRKASNDADQFIPVDAVGLLRASTKAARRITKQRGIKLLLDLPSQEFDVLANPHLLRVSFEQSLQWLAEKARDESEIKVTCIDAVADFVVRYECTGAGTSSERLRECLAGERVTDADEFRRLRELRNWFERWGSRLTIEGDEHDGIVLEMHLKRHQWSVEGMRGETPANQLLGSDSNELAKTPRQIKSELAANADASIQEEGGDR